MAIPTSVQGGSSHGASVLSSAEKIVAQHALAKLGVSSDPAVKGVSTVKLPSSSLSGTDSIKVASQTASSIKAESATPKTSTSTLTLSDKTTVTLTGVSTHNVVKPH